MAPTRDVGEIYNWTELLHFFNHTLPECHMELNENTKRVALFVLYLAIFVPRPGGWYLCMNTAPSWLQGGRDQLYLPTAIPRFGLHPRQ